MSYDRFRALAKDLEVWSKAMTDAGLNHDMSATVLWAKDVARSIDPNLSIQRTGESEIYAAFMSLLLHNQKGLSPWLKLCQRLLSPSIPCTNWIQISSPRTIRRSQFRLDMALNLIAARGNLGDTA